MARGRRTEIFQVGRDDTVVGVVLGGVAVVVGMAVVDVVVAMVVVGT
jgi:hypothetical protein